jgi:hypothetical protein
LQKRLKEVIASDTDGGYDTQSGNDNVALRHGFSMGPKIIGIMFQIMLRQANREYPVKIFSIFIENEKNW